MIDFIIRVRVAKTDYPNNDSYREDIDFTTDFVVTESGIRQAKNISNIPANPIPNAQ